MCLVTQSCLTLCDPMDCSLPGSSVHGDSPGKNTGMDCHVYYFYNFLLWGKWKWSRSVAQSCPTLCGPMNCSLPHSSVHGIFQARVLEWVAISFSRGSSWPRDWIQISCIVGRRFTVWATREVYYGEEHL